jgi:hypothetical protein
MLPDFGGVGVQLNLGCAMSERCHETRRQSSENTFRVAPTDLHDPSRLPRWKHPKQYSKHRQTAHLAVEHVIIEKHSQIPVSRSRVAVDEELPGSAKLEERGEPVSRSVGVVIVDASRSTWPAKAHPTQSSACGSTQKGHIRDQRILAW